MNCFFVENEAASSGKGGGLYNYDSSVSAQNCVFYGNEAANGAGVANMGDSYGRFINCTFAENVADTYGSSMYNDIDSDGWVRVVNTIMYNETSPGAKRHIYNVSGSLATVAYSDVQNSGGSADWNGYAGVDAGGNIDIAPDFMMDNIANYTIYGEDGVLGTGDDGLVPVELCDAMDAADGYNSSGFDISGTVRTDIGRKTDYGIGSCSYVDMGAYEYGGGSICETANVVIMCFIDESKLNNDHYFGEAAKFESDLSEYNTLIGYPGFVVKAGCYVPPAETSGSSIFDVLPAVDYTVPSNITMEMFHERSDRGSMQEEWFTSIFNTLRNGMTPDYIFIFVDNSGSLYTCNLDPGFSSFVSWLQGPNGYPNAIIPEYPYYYEEDDERWLKWVNDGLISVFIDEN